MKVNTFFLSGVDKNVKECYIPTMKRATTFTEDYIETVENFWTGRWDNDNSAFIFLGVVIALGMFIPIFWSDICFYVVWFKDLLTQPIYGGCALIFYIRMVRRCRNRKKSSM